MIDLKRLIKAAGDGLERAEAVEISRFSRNEEWTGKEQPLAGANISRFPGFPGRKQDDLDGSVSEPNARSSMASELAREPSSIDREIREKNGGPTGCQGFLPGNDRETPGKTLPEGVQSNLLDLNAAPRQRTWGARSTNIDPPACSPPLAGWWRGVQLLSIDRDPCPGFRTGQWPRTHTAMIEFLRSHGECAARLGWQTLELFGVHPSVGAVRVDYCGALLLSGRSPVAQVWADLIRYEDGLAYRRKPDPSQAVPVWEFGNATTASEA